MTHRQDGFEKSGLGTVFGGTTGSTNLTGAGHTVDVVSDFTHATSKLSFGGTVTVGGTGTFIVATGGDLTLTSDTVTADLSLTGGVVRVQSGGTSTFSGTTTIGTDGILAIQGNNASPTLNLGGALTNAGLITLDDISGTNNATLKLISGGSLTNTGTIRTLNTDGGATGGRTIDGSLINTGILDIDQNTTISLTSSGESLDMVGGAVDAAAALTVDSASTGTTKVGTGTVFGGTTGSTNLTGAGHTVDVVSDFTHATSKLSFGGVVTVSGMGTFIVGTGGDLTLTNDTMAAPLSVTGGVLPVQGNGVSTISGTTTIGSGGILAIQGNNASPTLNLGGTLTNAGLITLDDISGTNNASLTVTSGGSLTNTGTIRTLNFDGGATGVRQITGDVANTGGIIDIDHNLTITGDVTSTGSIDIAGARTLTINGSGNTLTNQSGGTVGGTGTLNVSAITFANQGAIDAAGSGTVGSFAVTGAVAQTASGSLGVDIASASSFDVVSVSGAYAIDGTLNANFLGSFVPTTGQTFTVLNYGSRTGTFSSIVDNLGDFFALTPTYNATNLLLTVTFAADNTWNDDGTGSDWNTAGNWSVGSVPVAGDNVLLSSSASSGPTYSSGTQSIGAIFAQNDLTVSGGSLSLTGQSTFQSGTTLTVSGGTLGGAGAIASAGAVVMTGGALTGAGALSSSGTFDASLSTAKTVDKALNLSGTSTFSAGNTGINTFSGTGAITNTGTMTVERNTVINNAFTNASGGTLKVQGNSLNGKLTLGGPTISNAGTIILDSANSGSARTATLIATGVALSNAGTVRAQDTGGQGGARTIEGSLTNTGTLDIQTDAAVKIAGDTLDSQAGTITVASGKTLKVDVATSGGTTIIGNGTTLSGTGTVDIVGLNHNLTVVSDFTLGSTGPALTLGSTATGTVTIGGSGTFTIGSGATLTMSGDGTAAGSSLVNQGTLILDSNDIDILGSFSNAAGALLKIQGFNTSTNTKGFANSFTNAGTITFDQTGGILNKIDIQDGSGGTGTLTNTGTFQTLNSAGLGGRRVFKGLFDNQGTLDVDYTLELDAATIVTHLNSGTIDIASGQTLDLKAQDDLTNQSSGTIQGFGTLKTNATGVDFINQGTIAPGTVGTVGTLAVFGDATQTSTATLKVDIADTANLDSLSVSGTYAIDGTIQASFINNFVPFVGQAFTVATYTFRTGPSAFTSASDDLGSEYSLTPTTGATSTTVTVGFTPVNTFTGSGNLNMAGNWSAGSVPGSTDAVLISSGASGNGTLSSSTLSVGAMQMQKSTTLTSATLNLGGPSAIGSGATLTLTDGTIGGTGPLTNHGSLTVGNGGSNFITGTFSNDSGGTILIGNIDSTTLSITSGFTNAGTMIIDNTNNASRTTSVTSGTVTNTGTLLVQDTGGGGGARNLTANLTNQGLLDVNHGLTILNLGKTFDSTAGSTIDVQSGQTLTVDRGTMIIGSNTTLKGSGTINLINNGTNLSLASNVTLTSSGPQLSLGGTSGVATISGAGTLTIGSGASLTLNDDTVSAALVNQGSLTVGNGGSNFITGTFSNASGGTFLIGNIDSTTLSITNPFTNTGTMIIDNTNSASRTTSVTSGTVTNTGTLLVQDTGGGGGARNLTANLTNQGLLDVNDSLTLNKASAAHTSSGTIDIDSGDTLTISGTGSSLTNQSGGVVQGAGTLILSSTTFTNSGTLSPGGDGTVGTLTVSGSVAQTSSAALDIDIAGSTAGSFDVLAVTGGYDVDGTLDLNFKGGHGTGDGSSFVVATFGSNTGTTFSSVSHNLSAAYTATPTYNAGNITVILSASFDRTWDGEGADGAWDTATNWSADTVPASGDDIEINAAAVTHSTGTGASDTSTINSLSLTGSGGALTLSGGTLSIGAQSRADSGTTFTLSGGTLAGTGPLRAFGTTTLTSGTIDGALTVAGSGSIGAGNTINGSGTLGVSGSLTVNSGATLNAGLTNTGTTTVTAATLAGTTANNAGTLHILPGTTSITGSFSNASGATVKLGNTSGTTSLTVSNAFTNAGTIVLTDATSNTTTDTLTVSSGTLTNTGTIQVENPSGGNGNRTMDFILDNQGILDIDTVTTLTNTGRTFANTGTINLATTLTVDGGTVTFGTGTLLQGTGTLSLINAADLTLSTNTSFLDQRLSMSGSGTVSTANGSALTTGSTATFNGTTVAVTYTNFGTTTATTTTFSGTTANKAGTLSIQPGTTSITGAFSNASGATVKLGDNSTASLTVANAFTNAGTILLTDATSNTNTKTLTVSNGTLTNTGTIQTVNPSGGTGNRTLDFVLDNQGTLDIDTSTTMNKASAIHVNTGTIDIASGRTLTVTSSGVSSLTNQLGGTLSGSGTLVAAVGTFTNNGAWNPGGDGTVGTLTVTGSVNQSSTATHEFDVASTSSFDKLVFNGSGNYVVAGALDFNFLPGAAPASGTTYDIITYVTRSGAPNYAALASHNLSAAYTGTPSFTSIASLPGAVRVTFTASFDRTWDGDASTSVFGTAANWDSDTLPNANNVLINAATVVHASETTSINSLTASGSGAFTLSGGSLTLAAASRIDSATSFTFSGGTLAGAGQLHATGTTTLGTATLDGKLSIAGTGTIASSTLGGTGTLTVTSGGTLTASGTTAFAGAVTSAAGGTLVVSQGFSLNTNATFSQDLTNQGTLQLTSSSGSGSRFAKVAMSGTTTLHQLGYHRGAVRPTGRSPPDRRQRHQHRHHRGGREQPDDRYFRRQ